MARPSLGTDWYRLRPDRNGNFLDHTTGTRLGTYKRPFASTPPATADLLEVILEDHPTATVAQARDMINYDPELVAILNRHISDGYGHLYAVPLFTHPSSPAREAFADAQRRLTVPVA